VAGTLEATSSSSLEPSEGLFAKLSPGPGKPAAEVAAHQRGRIFSAMIEIVGEEGYGAVTVRELSKLAGVSTRTFYAHFEGKEECFLRTYELVVQRAVAGMAASQDEGRDWQDRLRLAFDAFAREVATKPREARLALVEAFAAGPAVLERMRCAEGIFESMLAEGSTPDLGDVETSPLLIKGIVSGVSHLARTRLLSGRELELPGLGDELLDWALCFHDETVEFEWLPAAVAPGPRPALEGRRRPPYAIEDERDLILTATTKLAVTDGYQQLSVSRICASAGVRRGCFEARFEGVRDCFLTAVELRTSLALEVAIECAAGRSWAFEVHDAIAALCGQVAHDPVLAKLAFVEIFGPGEAGVLCRERIMARITERFRLGIPSELPTGEVASEASVGALWGILHHCVTAGRARQLPRIAPVLTFLTLAPILGAGNAADVCMAANIAANTH
jgi:AcrR family transcriptional regulator